MAPSAVRGISGAQGSVHLANRSQSTGIESLLDTTSAAPNALDSLVGEMQLGNQLMIPLPPDELGARIYTEPQTGLPTGYFHLCYVRFRQRARGPSRARKDPTTLYFLVKWMSGNTRIQARLAGRTLYLDDPGIMDSPMLYLVGERLVRLTQRERLENSTTFSVETEAVLRFTAVVTRGFG